MKMTPTAAWLNRTFAPFDDFCLRHLNRLFNSPFGNFFRCFSMLFDWIGRNGVVFISFGLVLSIFSNTRKMGVAVLLSLSLGTLVTNLIFKPLVRRPRPYRSGYSAFWKQVRGTTERDASFPSGHTTAAMTLVTALFFVGSMSFGWLLFLFAIAMGFSRCYLMVHYPSDVVAALFIGFLTGWLSAVILAVTWKEQLL